MSSIKMLPKPTEKTRGAIVSAASTAPLVFEVGLSVAGKGGVFFGNYERIKVVFCRFLTIDRGVLVLLLVFEGSFGCFVKFSVL